MTRRGSTLHHLLLALLIALFAGQTALAAAPEAQPPTPAAEAMVDIATSALDVLTDMTGDSSTEDSSSPWLDYYIVQLTAAPLAAYEGGITGLKATSPEVTSENRLNLDSPNAQVYRAYLGRQQDRALAEISETIGHEVDVLHRYDVAYNGFAVKLTPEEAAEVAELPGVRHIERNRIEHALTDAGPGWIGAPGIWGGTTTGGLPGTKGEGVIAGIIDSGINFDHPSFAATGGDGHTHVNPLGAGVYKGWCNAGYAVTVICNSKLIGAWSFVDSGNNPEDDDGHGSHTASTTAGNVVNAALVAPTTTLNHQISGVAPHANIIAYDACTGGSCPSTALLAAVNQAVSDGVDVINYSISGGDSPYSDAVSQAFLNAVGVGVFVSASAGNSGPGAATSAHLEPWVQTVGASTHDRLFDNALVNLSGGATAPPANINGVSVTSGFGPAPVVYAGNYGDPLCPLGAFPAGTFSGQIVVCDRGVSGRVDKAQSVKNGGAVGFVLANDAANGNSLVGDAYPLPGVHISYANGVTLKSWLASGTGHTGTIQGTTLSYGAANGDIMASFSSRGPSSLANTLKPDITGPGVDIWAAIASLGSPAPPEYGVLSGTSMSSPHSAGSAALLIALHPTWSPAMTKSALMTTSKTSGVKKEDGATAADPFDMGAGRIDLSQAGQAGLVLNETKANYTAANPGIGGNPATLNTPSMASSSCAPNCSWTRTFTSVRATGSTWTASVSAPAGMTVIPTPSPFTIAAGGTQAVNVSVSFSGLTANNWYFATVTWTDGPGGAPDVHLPIAAFYGSGSGGATITVNTPTDEKTTNSFCSLREAITNANNNAATFPDCAAGVGADTIVVPANTYTLVFSGRNEDSNGRGDLDVRDSLTLNGAGAASTVINANGIDRVFDIPGIPNVNLNINDLTIRGGSTATPGSLFGGGMRINTSGSVILNNASVTNNSAPSSSGGGIQLTSGALYLINTTVMNNTALSSGGGINANNSQSSLTVTNSTISNNVARTLGGGVYAGSGSPTTALNNATITGNSAASTTGANTAGGGMLIAGGIVTVDNSTISNNATSSTGADTFGGGITIAGGIVTVDNSTISNNTASSTGGAGVGLAGGIYNEDGSSLTITGSTITGNTATYHAGLRVVMTTAGGNTTTSLTDTTVSGNIATGEGAGIVILTNPTSGTTTTAALNLTRGTVNGNQVTGANGGGGGIETYYAGAGTSALTVNVTNSTISGNSVTGTGAGIWQPSGGGIGTQVTNFNASTIAGNTAAFAGGVGAFAGTLNVRNTIVADNTATSSDPDCSGTLASQDYNLIENVSAGCTVTGATTHNITGIDPALGALASNGGPTQTRALGSASAAIDAADVATCPSTDQRGQARADWQCDIGAFELKLSDANGHTVSKAFSTPGTYTFGPTLVKVQVTGASTCLTGLGVQQTDGNHPQAGASLQTGRYWGITPAGCATGYTADLTLPTSFTPDASSVACYYTGSQWDCGASSFDAPNKFVTRSGVTHFSDWVAGQSNPTAITLRGVRAVREPMAGSQRAARVALSGLVLIVLAAGWTLHTQAYRRR